MKKTTKTLLIAMLAFSGLSNVANAQWTNQTSGTSDDLNDVHFIDDNTGWAVGRFGALVTTTNGGSTWSAQNSATSYDLNDVYMVSSGIGYAVGDHGTVVKYTGSSTWATLTSGTTLDLFGVHFINASTGWISGDYGRIMMTTDGGATWTTQVNNSTYTNLFNDIYMLSSNEGWAVGTNGKILKYDGTNWSTITSGTNNELLGVNFSSSNNGFAVGKGSTILFYNGSSWTTSNSGLTSYNINNVYIISQNAAYAATSDGFGGTGKILKYNGSTWSADYTYTGIGTEIFYGVYFPSVNKGYVVGAGGMIKTTGSGSSGINDVHNDNSDVTLYPNPANEKVFIEIAEYKNAVAEIFNLKGQLLQSIPLCSSQTTIKTDNLASGIYFVQIKNSEGMAVRKLVKQ